MTVEYLVDDKFLERMDHELAGWSDPATRLREALEGDEFTLYCQPIVALREGDRFPMAEVLARMREEERALLPPGEFLPVFEHFGERKALAVTAQGGDRLAIERELVLLERLAQPRRRIAPSGELLVHALEELVVHEVF